MNLAAILLGFFCAKLFYQAAGQVLLASPLASVPLLLVLEVASLAVGGFLVATMSGPSLKKRKANAGMMALLAGGMQIVANGGGLHWLHFAVMLLYVPAAVWGAGRYRR